MTAIFLDMFLAFIRPLLGLFFFSSDIAVVHVMFSDLLHSADMHGSLSHFYYGYVHDRHVYIQAVFSIQFCFYKVI